MEEERLIQANEKKERDKQALYVALAELQKLALVSNETDTIQELLKKPDSFQDNVKIIPELHKEGLLKQYLQEFKLDYQLLNSKLTSIIEKLINAISVKSSASPSTLSRTSSAELLSVYPIGVSHKLGCRGIFSLSPKTRENLKTAGMLACPSIGLALFLGTGIAGFVLSAKAAATATAVVACAATAGTAFPPLGIALLAVSAAMILASAIILIALAANQKGKGSTMSSTFSTGASSLSYIL